jgi:hypothetical protein
MICCNKNFNNTLLNTEMKKDVIGISNYDIGISNYDIGKDKNILIKPAVLDEQKVYEVQSENIILDKKYFTENFCEFIKENYKIIILILIILLILK